MERIESKTVYEGQIASVRIDRFRHADGSTAEREIVAHPGAVAVIAHDGETLYMVRQPREPVGEENLLELPAGKLDVEGETPLQCAQRELAEEVGVEAQHWRELKRIYTSPGFAEELVHIFLATDLREVGSSPDAEERLEVERVPLAELERVIAECMDSKTLIGLYLLEEELGS